MAQLMGADLGVPDEMPLKPIVTVKITGTSVGDLELGDNKYVGKMVLNEIAPTEASWLEDALDDSDLGFDTVDDCYVLDYANINNDGHSRKTDDIVTGNVIGYAPDGRFIVAVTDGGGDSGRWFRIVSSTRVDTYSSRWIYTARRVIKYFAGYGGWMDDMTDTADYTLYNGIDDFSNLSGTYGNGVSWSNLIGSFAPVPLGVGAKVHAMPVKVVYTGETEWWIDRVGQIDGRCEE